jgi:hypothetical protein
VTRYMATIRDPYGNWVAAPFPTIDTARAWVDRRTVTHHVASADITHTRTGRLRLRWNGDGWFDLGPFT